MSVQKLPLYTPVGSKVARGGEGHQVGSNSSKFSKQIEDPMKGILQRLQDRGIVSQRRSWPIHVACLTNISDRDIINWFVCIAISALSYYNCCDLKNIYPMLFQALLAKGHPVQALGSKASSFCISGMRERWFAYLVQRTLQREAHSFINLVQRMRLQEKNFGWQSNHSCFLVAPEDFKQTMTRSLWLSLTRLSKVSPSSKKARTPYHFLEDRGN